jgi:hypothetical protein
VVSLYLYNSGKVRFSFLQMINEADGDSALEGLDGAEFFGIELVVQWAKIQLPARGRASEMSTTQPHQLTSTSGGRQLSGLNQNH